MLNIKYRSCHECEHSDEVFYGVTYSFKYYMKHVLLSARNEVRRRHCYSAQKEQIKVSGITLSKQSFQSLRRQFSITLT